MAKFNVKKQQPQNFRCTQCDTATTYRIASSGCPKCGHYLFKVANRSGTPTAWDRDAKDPYLRQKQSPMGNNDGAGYKLTTPGDENGIGMGGSRFRGGLSPTGYSETENDYGEQNKKQLPSEDTNLDFPNSDGVDQQGWTVEPHDALSTTQQINQQMSNTGPAPLDKQLARQRRDTGLRTRLNDSVFGRTTTRLRGVQR